MEFVIMAFFRRNDNMEIKKSISFESHKNFFVIFGNSFPNNSLFIYHNIKNNRFSFNKRFLNILKIVDNFLPPEIKLNKYTSNLKN